MPRSAFHTQPLRTPLVLALMLALTLLAAGCSTTTEFDQVWDAAGSTPTPDDSITGQWVGQWQNENGGHSGKMRAVITRLDDTHYLAQYHAKYGGMFTFESVVPLRIEQTEAQRVEFSGEANLGSMAGGLYEYTGHATPDEFISDYTSRGNTGTYELTRPE